MYNARQNWRTLPLVPLAPPGHIHQKVVTLQRFSWKWQFKRTFITTLQVRRQKMFNRNAIMIYNFYKCNCKYRNFYVKTNRSKKWINISYVDTTQFHMFQHVTVTRHPQIWLIPAKCLRLRLSPLSSLGVLASAGGHQTPLTWRRGGDWGRVACEILPGLSSSPPSVCSEHCQ